MAMTPVERRELQVIASHIWRLGPRAVAEALEGVGDDDLLQILRPYLRITPRMLHAAGAEGFPPHPEGDDR
jgi:hypothetical protein